MDINFPPLASTVVAATANFIKLATHNSNHPASAIGGILATIMALYEPLNLFPT